MSASQEEQLRARISELEALLAMRGAPLTQIDELQRQNTLLRERLAVLEDQVRRLLRRAYGPSTEKMIHDPGQQQLDLGAIVCVAPAADPTPDKDAATGRRRRGAHGRRRLAELNPDLPVREEMIETPASARLDADGTPLVAMGRETTDLLAIEPPQVYIRRLVRIRYGRTDTGDKAPIVTLPPRICARGILDDSTIHHLMVQKFEDSLPFYRQESILRRHGVELSRNVMVDAARAWGDAFAPLADAIRAEILAEPVIHADESAMRMLDRTLQRRCRTTNLWAIVGGGQVAYTWTPDRTYARGREILAGYRGYLVRDEWQGWKTAFDAGGIIPVGCNAHARRPFAEMQAIDPDAALMVRHYARLAAVEHEANDSGLAGPALWEHRHALRAQRSRVTMDEIIALARQLHRERAPSSTIGKGAAYILRHTDTLTRFFDDGRLPPDNNLAENVLRIVAVLRKNCLFLGSPDGGAWTATALTILRSCRLQKLDPYRYLAAVTPALLDRRGQLGADSVLWTPRAFAGRANAAIAAA
jgi:transposase